MSDNDDDSDISSEEENTTVNKCSILEGWNREEKFKLLQAIKQYESSELKAIAASIPTKTHLETFKAIKYYKELALRANPTCGSKTKSCRNNILKIPFMPLAKWAKLLTENMNFKDLKNETAIALRLIAEYEEFPKPNNDRDIDFKNLYLILANAIEGKSLPKSDSISKSVIEKGLIETALYSKSFMRSTTLDQVLDNISLPDKTDDNFHNFSAPADGYELACIRHLMTLKAYNPYKIDEKFLKPMS